MKPLIHFQLELIKSVIFLLNDINFMKFIGFSG